MLDWKGAKVYVHCLIYIDLPLDVPSLVLQYSRHLCLIDLGVIQCSGCSGIQCIHAELTRWSICLLYICIVLDLAVDAVVCKASLLN